MPSVNVDFDDDDAEEREQFQWLKEVKERYGLTWRGMLILAARELEDGPPHKDDM